MPDAGSLAELNDGELVLRTRRGSIDAFDALVTRYRKGIYCLAFAMTQSHEAADDLSQDAFVQLFKRLRQLKDMERFGPWLRKILINSCIRHVSAPRPTSLEDCEEQVARSGIPSDTAEQGMVRESVRSAILNLDPSERAVVLLYYMEGLKQTEIAEALECPIGTVWSRLNSARAHLRTHLADLI